MEISPHFRRYWPAFLLVVLAVLEPVSASLGGIVTVVAAWTWATLSFLVLLASWFAIGRRLVTAAREGHAMLLIVFVLGALITFARLRDVETLYINREATQQVNAGVENWFKPDLGYHESAFLGGNYPARQYVLVATPTFLAGRDVATLRLGYGFLFFTGWALFLVALDVRWPGGGGDAPRRRSPIPVLAALTLLTFPPVIHWLLNYEQTILPLSFVLLATGWLGLWLRERRPLLLIPLAWSAGMLGTAYTPALAAWALAVGLFSLGFFHRTFFAPSFATAGFTALGSVGLYTLSMGATTLWTMRAILPGKFTTRTVINESPLSLSESVSRVGEGFRALFVHHELPYIHPVVALLFLAPLLWLLTQRPSRRTLLPGLLALWMLGVIVAAVTLRGYCHRPPAFDLHRTMVILPILLLLTGAFWRSVAGPWLESWNAPLRLFAAVLAAVAVAQFCNVRDPVSYQPYEPDTEVDLAMRVQHLSRRLPDREHASFTTWVHPGLATGGSVLGLTEYFTPRVEIRREIPDLASLHRAAKPFVALLPEDEATRLSALQAGFSAEVLPGRPRLDHLPKAYLLIVYAGAPPTPVRP